MLQIVREIIGITASRTFELSTWVFFISLMQSSHNFLWLLPCFYCLLILQLHLHLNRYNFLHKYLPITIAIQTWLQHRNFEYFDWFWLFFWFILHTSSFISTKSFVSQFFRWLLVSSRKFMTFLYSILSINL